MKVADAFIILSPVVVVRLSDGFSVGFTDVAWVIFLPFIVSRYKTTFNNWPSFWCLSFLIILLSSSAFNFMRNGSHITDLALLRVAFIMIPFFYALSLEPSIDRVNRLTKLFVLSGGIALTIGILLHVMGIQIKTNQQMLWVGDGTGPKIRAGGILGNSSDYGLLASSWGSICGLLVLALFPRRRWLWFAAISVLSTYAVWISASRSGLLHLAIAWGIGVPFLMRAQNWLVTLLVFSLAAPIILTLLPGATLILPENIAYTLRRLDFLDISGESSFYHTVRFINWGFLLNIGLESWPTGIGYKAIATRYGEQGIYGDNAFLTVFVEFGLITATLYLTFWASTFWAGVKHFKSSTFGVILTAIVVSEFFHSVTLDTFTAWSSAPLMWFFVALLYRNLRYAPKSIAPRRQRKIVWHGAPLIHSHLNQFQPTASNKDT